MKVDIRTIFLKSLPYLMSITGGIILYTGAIDNAPNDNIRDLVINVSASLLSIPLVFLLYDYTNSRVANQMKKNLANSITDKINVIMLNLIMILRDSLNMRGKITQENLNRMLISRHPEISRRLKLTPRILVRLNECHSELDTILYRNGQTNVLTPEHTQILSSIARDMAHIINENKFHRGHRLTAKYLENIMDHILDWLDMDSISTLNFQRHLTGIPPEGTPEK